MKKIALFVEGQTDQIFAEKLIREIIGKHGFSITKFKFLGGKKSIRKPLFMTTQNTSVDNEYYFIIYDCGGDDRVQSDIRERLDSLREESFSLVIGIRDVYPETDIEKLRRYLYFGIPSKPDISVKIILAVNEIAGIDVSKDNTESIFHPSDTLKQIYMKAGTTYDKSKEKIQRTVEALNYENLYINVRNRNNSLNELLTCLDRIIT